VMRFVRYSVTNQVKGISQVFLRNCEFHNCDFFDVNKAMK